MLARIASLAVTRPRTILLAALALAVLCGIGGASVVGHMKSGGFTPPDAESAQVTEFLDEHFPGAEPNYVLLVTTPDGVDAPDARKTGEQIVTLMRGTSGVDSVLSYWAVPAPFSSGLRSTDGTKALVTAHIEGDDTTSPNHAADLTTRLESAVTGVELHAGGPTMAYHDINGQITADLAKAELVAIPISAFVLVLVFGSVVAAMLPLAVGVFAILGVVRDPARPHAGHRRVDLRAEPHHRARPGARDRLQPVHGEPLPRGTGQRAATSRPR